MDEARTTLQSLSIGGNTPTGGANQFSEQMERLFSVGLAVNSIGTPFYTQLTGYRGRRLRFASLRFSPHTTTSVHMGRRQSRVLVSLQKDGVAMVQQSGRESRIEPGDMFMIDPARPFSIETGEILTHSVYLEPESLRAALPDYEHLTARALRCDGGTGGLYRSVVDEMFKLAETLDEDTADRIADSLPHLLSAAMVGVRIDGDSPPSRLRQMHKQRIFQFARENICNRDLDAKMVATSVQLSTRYLYELFEDEPQPLMKWVWNLRLERCQRDLSTPALASRPISEIAYYWGFNDGAHFSRAFRLRFGQSPREFRIAALTKKPSQAIGANPSNTFAVSDPAQISF